MKLSGILLTRHDTIFNNCENSFSKPIVNMTTRKMPLYADYRYAIPTVNFPEDASR